MHSVHSFDRIFRPQILTALGRLNQSEFALVVDPLITSQNGEKEHHHNRLILAIVANVSREVPDPGVAPWVSANDKPAAAAGSKPVTGDAAERRLKGGVMQLPAKDRRRIKDLMHNDFDPQENLVNAFTDARRRPSAINDVPASATGTLNNMNFDLEIRKRFNPPLAVESGEFPDQGVIGGRMLPFCYEAGLVGGHGSDAPTLMTVATETFIKEALTQIFSRTRCNGPGEAGSAGFGVGTTWVRTFNYGKQLHAEEDAAQHGRLTRDKNGLLPVESKAASEREAISMADMRLSLEVGDSGMATFPTIMAQIMYGYREGELERWDDYTYADGFEPTGGDDFLAEINGGEAQELPNGVDPMDIDNEPWWDGAESHDQDMLDGLLDSCLAAAS